MRQIRYVFSIQRERFREPCPPENLERVRSIYGSMPSTDPRCRVTIDLKAQRLILPGGRQVTFPIDTFNKSCMLTGTDALGYLLEHKNQIEAYEKAHSKKGNLL
jgi:3-isopropylmalate dehydratase small subunit